MVTLDARQLRSRLSKGASGELLSFEPVDFFTDDVRVERLGAYLDGRETVDAFDIAGFINSETSFDIHNRKYLGSKYNLLDFIEETITGVVGKRFESFFDCCAGTGIVGQRFRSFAGRVITNDILRSNYLIHRAFLCSTRDTVRIRKLRNICDHLNRLPPLRSYVTEHFGGTYFTGENASRIDAIREEIERLSAERECSDQERACLIASLLYAIDKAANTVGQYDAFLKHIDIPAFPGGRHTVDTNVYKPVRLRRPFIYFDGVNKSYCEDAETLAERVKAEVVYLDPPYNGRQYVDCYHVLENIARWEKPPTFGKTKKYPREEAKSRFSRKRSALTAFSSLVSKLDCAHLFLSYNSEGILTVEQIREVLATRGRVNIFEKDYPVFGNGAGVSVNRRVRERLFHCRIDRKPAWTCE
jgi:adenine-specific DNA-methyltransferase